MEVETTIATLGPQAENELLIADALQRMLQPSPKYTKCRKGDKHGTVTVICYSHSFKRLGMWISHWVVRCRCGNFELRTGRELGQPDATDACDSCKQLQALRIKASNIYPLKTCRSTSED